MFNVAVVRLKDLIKYVLIITVLITIFIISKRYVKKRDIDDINLSGKISKNMSKYVKNAINQEIPIMKEIENKEIENTESIKNEEEDIKQEDGKKSQLLKELLGVQLSAINMVEKKIKINTAMKTEENNVQSSKKNGSELSSNSEKNNDVQNKENSENDDEKIEMAKENVKTEVTTKNPIVDAYTKKYRGVKIKNETSFNLVEEDLNPDKLKIDKSNIIIFHTHTCESYTSSEKYNYKPTGNFRTTNLNYSVARVGDELTKYLKKYKLNVVHNKTYHDYPSYNGSYSRSLSTVTQILKNTKADIIIDLHRDAIGSYSSYAPTVKIGDDACSQLMFVIGSDGGKLNHPNWKTNLKFAIKLQEKANKKYPGLFKPIILRNSRYNQHLAKAACIIEVGSTGNTLEQCLNSMKYLSKILNEI